MSVIVLGEGAQEQLLAAKKFAREHPLTMEDLHRLIAKQKTVKHDEQILPIDHYVKLESHPHPIEVGITYEIQPPNRLWHCSLIFMGARKTLPHPFAVNMILMEAGFPSYEAAVQILPVDNVIHLWFLDTELN
jgi:hypothetical protein